MEYYNDNNCHITYYETTAWGVRSQGGNLERIGIARRDSGPLDVEIDVAYCGLNQLDMHFINNDFGTTEFPIIPGCEISGVISKVGKEVPRHHFRLGDKVGVGLIVGSCQKCEECEKGRDQACIHQDFTQVYNSRIRHGQNLFTDKRYTFGGLSCRITVHYRYVVKIPYTISMYDFCPLVTLGLCAFSALKHWKATEGGLYIGVIGVGLLGQIAIQIATEMGNDVTAITATPAKKKTAVDKCRALDCLISSDEPFERLKGGRHKRLDLILNTIGQPHDLGIYLPLLAYGGTIVQMGLVPEPIICGAPFPDLQRDRLTITSNFLGGTQDLYECVKFCSDHRVSIPTRLITATDLNEAFHRIKTERSQSVRYVVDVRKSYGDLTPEQIITHLTPSIKEAAPWEPTQYISVMRRLRKRARDSRETAVGPMSLFYTTMIILSGLCIRISGAIFWIRSKSFQYVATDQLTEMAETLSDVRRRYLTLQEPRVPTPRRSIGNAFRYLMQSLSRMSFRRFSSEVEEAETESNQSESDIYMNEVDLHQSDSEIYQSEEEMLQTDFEETDVDFSLAEEDQEQIHSRPGLASRTSRRIGKTLNSLMQSVSRLNIRRQASYISSVVSRGAGILKRIRERLRLVFQSIKNRFTQKRKRGRPRKKRD